MSIRGLWPLAAGTSPNVDLIRAKVSHKVSYRLVLKPIMPNHFYFKSSPGPPFDDLKRCRCVVARSSTPSRRRLARALPRRAHAFPPTPCPPFCASRPPPLCSRARANRHAADLTLARAALRCDGPAWGRNIRLRDEGDKQAERRGRCNQEDEEEVLHVGGVLAATRSERACVAAAPLCMSALTSALVAPHSALTTLLLPRVPPAPARLRSR